MPTSAVLTLLLGSSCLAAGQAGHTPREAAGAESGPVYQRKVQLPQGPAPPAVVMTEFLTHGELDARGEDLAVEGARGEPVPWKILQVGPGDLCRVAFQTAPKQLVYKILYGGKAPPRRPPGWTARAGLLLETRRMKPCDFNRVDSVRAAFAEAEPFGAAFVGSVFHRYNPFWPEPEPFLSAYRGTLRIARGGTYQFFTSSQDCSFLSIDGKLVVAAPGWHGPVHDARIRGEIDLSPGPHDFEYLHGASGPDACMVAAWRPPGAAKPEPIPAEALGAGAIARAPAVSVRHPREFTYEILGDAPLADGDQPLVRVQFRQVSSRGSTSRPRLHWNFGDGQTSNQGDPSHIYLRPGTYAVAMRTPGEPDAPALTARVPIHRALILSDEDRAPDQLSSYLGLLERYDPAKLDPEGLLQLIRAFRQSGQAARAAKAGQAGVLAWRGGTELEAGREAVRLVASLLGDELDAPESAFAFLKDATNRLRPEAWRAECELDAAELALCPLLRTEPAGMLLDSAAARLASGEDPALLGRLQRLRGDWHARKGDRDAARAAYATAAATPAPGPRRSAGEQDAWRGALSRSTEEFLRSGALDRARDEFRRWQAEFPADRVEGHLTYLQARYWAARSGWPQAIALAGDLLAVNPESPYADRIAFLAAGCEERLGHPDRARAAYRSLIADYPGSPLVAAARKKLETPAKP